MIGLIVAICRGHVDESILNQAFSLEKVNIPRAPGLGLMLEFVHYDRYNNRYGSDGMHDKLLWEEENEKVNKFAEEYVFPKIIDLEIDEKRMLTWLNEKLSRHRFDKEEEEEVNDEECKDEDEQNEGKEKDNLDGASDERDDGLKKQSSVQ